MVGASEGFVLVSMDWWMGKQFNSLLVKRAVGVFAER